MAKSMTKTGLEPALTSPPPARTGNEPGFGHSVMDLLEPLTGELDAVSGLPVRVRHRGDGAEMALVPAGYFTRGRDDGEQNEQPAREIWLDAYYIDVHPVTNARYRPFLDYMQATDDHSRCHTAEHLSSVTRELRHTPRLWAKHVRGYSEERFERFGGDDQPVVTVTWYDAFAFARWSGKSLPSEAQWEKAGRGSDRRLFPWGRRWDQRRLNCDLSVGQTTVVDRFNTGASPFGVLDMLGNVWEWCLDRYDRRGYVNGPSRNPTGPPDGLDRVCRGGAWNYVADYATVTARHAFGPSEAYEFIGFRTVLPLHPAG